MTPIIDVDEYMGQNGWYWCQMTLQWRTSRWLECTEKCYDTCLYYSVCSKTIAPEQLKGLEKNGGVECPVCGDVVSVRELYGDGHGDATHVCPVDFYELDEWGLLD